MQTIRTKLFKQGAINFVSCFFMLNFCIIRYIIYINSINAYSSYLSITSDGRIFETPIIYENDKIEFGERSGFLGFGFNPLISMPIGNPSPASQDYQNLFNQFIGK